MRESGSYVGSFLLSDSISSSSFLVSSSLLFALKIAYCLSKVASYLSNFFFLISGSFAFGSPDLLTPPNKFFFLGETEADGFRSFAIFGKIAYASTKA